MGDDVKAPAVKKAETKRKMLTPAERVAKLEAELAEAKKKAEAKGKVQITELQTKRGTLVKQIAERQAKVAGIDTQLKALGVDTGAPSISAKAS